MLGDLLQLCELAWVSSHCPHGCWSPQGSQHQKAVSEPALKSHCPALGLAGRGQWDTAWALLGREIQDLAWLVSRPLSSCLLLLLLPSPGLTGKHCHPYLAPGSLWPSAAFSCSCRMDTVGFTQLTLGPPSPLASGSHDCIRLENLRDWEAMHGS